MEGHGDYLLASHRVTARRRIVVYQLGTIGDTVVSMPALAAVRRHYGASADITLLHDRQSGPVTPRDLLEGTGLVDRYLDYPVSGGRLARLAAAAALLVRLRRERFAAAVYVAPSERPAASVARDRRFFALAGVPELRGFIDLPGQRAWHGKADHARPAVRREAAARLDRLASDEIDVSAESDLTRPFLRLPPLAVAAADAWLEEHRRHPTRPLVAICPGTSKPANQWPVDRFEAIGRRLQATALVELVVVGGPAERDTASALVAAWGDGLAAAGALPVLGSASLLARCAFIVGLDTGTTHLAAAAGVPCVAIYGGRETPGLWDPLGRGHEVLRHPVPCAGCRLSVCPLPEHPCLSGVTTDVVWAAVERRLARIGSTSTPGR